MLAPTPLDKLIDSARRPYFLWDVEMTLDELEDRLAGSDERMRVYLTAKLMRQAKPDDALQFVSPQQIADDWAALEPYLGKEREFWRWLLDEWGRRGFIRR